MQKVPVTSSSVLMLLIFLFCVILTPSASENADHYVRDACSVTRYQDLCVRSLSPFSATAKNSPGKWARAAVSVTIAEAKTVAEFLSKTRRLGGKREKIAFSDCVELFQDALDELHRSLAVLRRMTAVAEEEGFQDQVSDLLTWLSAALTDEDTCLDGFEGGGGRMTRYSTVRIVRRKVLNATYVTSNALAFVNRLATDGL